jgi:hypothetical protein
MANTVHATSIGERWRDRQPKQKCESIWRMPRSWVPPTASPFAKPVFVASPRSNTWDGQTDDGLPPVAFSLFIKAKLFWLNEGVSDEYLSWLCSPFRDKAWVVCNNRKVSRYGQRSSSILALIEIRTMQSPKCIVWRAVDCTYTFLFQLITTRR